MWLAAPFDADLIDRINRAQAGVVASAAYPLTCPQARDGRHALAGGYIGVLVAQRRGLVCPTCGHVQGWLPAAVLKAAERTSDEPGAAQAQRIERMRQAALEDFRRLVRAGHLSAQPMVETLEAMAPRPAAAARSAEAAAADALALAA
ncbi:MAG: hypothetical protein RMK34_01715 [Tepidimonas sp.]|uniref:hypothetical protein n=1 Tax=Tepidimonas sp. TaxID=2002775 RepID=UPI00298EE53F|nr:hypothetical protein [Tepidimonas sp.]MCS6809882.1 hypothetical protein [Tepidimonas sp.]MDW8335667.1 hypothetical protein [Tepidimonas sp.]